MYEGKSLSCDGDISIIIIIINRDWCNLYKRMNFLYVDLSVSFEEDVLRDIL